MRMCIHSSQSVVVPMPSIPFVFLNDLKVSFVRLNESESQDTTGRGFSLTDWNILQLSDLL